jgi:hypothetical protein
MMTDTHGHGARRPRLALVAVLATASLATGMAASATAVFSPAAVSGDNTPWVVADNTPWTPPPLTGDRVV